MRKFISDNKYNLPLVLLNLLVIRILVSGAGIGDSLALMALAGLIGYIKFSSDKEISNSELINSELVRIQKELSDLKGSITAVKLDKGIYRKNSNHGQTDDKRLF